MTMQQLVSSVPEEQLEFFGELIEKRRLNEDSEYSGGSRDTINLYHAVDDFLSKQIDFPPHQREPSWTRAKRIEYITTLCNDRTPPGCFEFYKLKGKDGRLSITYLNDGSQRLRAAVEFFNNPHAYSITKSDAEYILRNTSYPFTMKLHRSHQEALVRFQIVNNNVALTSYQIVIGDIVYCTGNDSYEQWQTFIKNLHNRMEILSARIVDRPVPNLESVNYLPKLHVLRRHDLSLYLRYITNEKSFRDYKPNTKLNISSGDYFEKDLSVKLAQIGIGKANEQLDTFFRLLELETALIEEKWHKVKEDAGHFIKTSTFRWLMDCAIWRRAIGIESPKWEDFISKFLSKSKGLTILGYIKPDGTPNRLNVTVSRVSDLPRVCNLIDSDLMQPIGQEHLTTSGMRAGWQNSHKIPRKFNGDGPTFREPGGPNMSRGAKPVDSPSDESNEEEANLDE